MGYYMSELYRRYFRATDFSELEEEIENTRQEVRDCLVRRSGGSGCAWWMRKTN